MKIKNRGKYIMLFDDKIRTILTENKSIAIVGAKDKPGSPVEHVGRYLIEKGYTIYPVHPVRQTAWGIPCVKNLEDLQEQPDIVCLFRASEACLEHAQEIMRAPWKPKVFWMQLGIFNKEAGELMAKNGILVVEDLCMEVEHKRIFA